MPYDMIGDSLSYLTTSSSSVFLVISKSITCHSSLGLISHRPYAVNALNGQLNSEGFAPGVKISSTQGIHIYLLST